MKFNKYAVPYNVYEDFNTLASEGTYRTLSASALSGYVPYALLLKVNAVTLMASASGQHSLYVANLHRVDQSVSAIDQQPLIIEFDHSASVTYAGFVDHGNWPGRTTPFGKTFSDHIAACGIGAPTAIAEKPSAESGSLDDLQVESQTKAFQAAFSALRSYKNDKYMPSIANETQSPTSQTDE